MVGELAGRVTRSAVAGIVFFAFSGAAPAAPSSEAAETGPIPATMARTTATPARSPMEANFTSLDVGTYATNLVPASGRGGTLTNERSVAAFLRLRRGWHLGREAHFEPSFGVIVPWRGGVDGSLRIITSHLSLPFSFPLPFARPLRFRVGPGVHWIFYWPSGDEVRLNNGASTATFYIPSQPSHVFLTTVDAGLEWRITAGFSAGIDVTFLQILSAARRRMNASLTLGVVL